MPFLFSTFWGLCLLLSFVLSLVENVKCPVHPNWVRDKEEPLKPAHCAQKATRQLNFKACISVSVCSLYWPRAPTQMGCRYALTFIQSCPHRWRGREASDTPDRPHSSEYQHTCILCSKHFRTNPLNRTCRCDLSTKISMRFGADSLVVSVPTFSITALTVTWVRIPSRVFFAAPAPPSLHTMLSCHLSTIRS